MNAIGEEAYYKVFASSFLANKIRYYEKLRIAKRKLRNLRIFYQRKINSNTDSEKILNNAKDFTEAVHDIGKSCSDTLKVEITADDHYLMNNRQKVGPDRSFLYGEHVYDFIHRHEHPGKIIT